MFGKRIPLAALPLLCACVWWLPAAAAVPDGPRAAWARPLPVRLQDTLSVTSPDRSLVWRAQMEHGRVTGFRFMSVHGSTVTPCMPFFISSYGLTTAQGWGNRLCLVSVSRPTTFKAAYRMVAGKRKVCKNEAREVTYTFVDDQGHGQQLTVRVFNDGVAFRYRIDGLPEGPVPQEQTAYHIDEGTARWMLEWSEGYEGFYPLSASGHGSNHRWGYPALLQTGRDTWTLISEAGIGRRHSASSLYNDRADTEYRVVADENRLQTRGTWTTPWRVVIMGSERQLVESTLVTDVSEPSRLKSTRWIKPGGVSWVYWAYNHGSNDYQIVRKYVDMAVTLHLPYVLIDAEWDEMKNGGHIEDAIRYALQRGVKPILWYNSSTAWTKQYGAPGPHERLNRPEDREREFAWLERMGVAGVKIDFFAGDKQSTMSYCIDLLECAARHHLLVNFHGATVPRGWQRTYPNLMSVEGVYGAEWYNNNGVLTSRAAAHNATLPFTRNVIGSMDYTPCTFSDSQHPHITTRAHELALPVLFESALLHWADRPESYLSQPQQVQDFIGSLPTVWDETRFVSGYPGRSAVLARRRGSVWYVAGINGLDTRQTLSVDLPFVGKTQSYRLFADNSKADGWVISDRNLPLPQTVDCQPRGGFVMVVKTK